MKLTDFIHPEEIRLDLESDTKYDAIHEMVDLLRLEKKAQEILLNLLRKREELGSTGIGSGVALPHSRSLVVDRLRVAFGRKLSGIDFGSVDGQPVRFLFLLVAPPVEVSNQYLPVLGRIAQFCKNADNLERLARVTSVDQFMDALTAADV
ncbi:MAG TPA: PTS sugar transporter subunit IIA [Gemmatimonadota bacterium]|jgi:mannitol/fructose-specific phosphotransferase system IIA component (Ntr-type)